MTRSWQVQLSEEDPRFEVDIEGSWHPYAMNPKLLLSRYLQGGHFSPHTDRDSLQHHADCFSQPTALDAN